LIEEISTLKQRIHELEHAKSDNKEAKEARQDDDCLRRLVDILQHPSESIQDFLDYALDQAIQLAGSKIGYIYHYIEDRKEFILNTWSKDVMPECAVANTRSVWRICSVASILRGTIKRSRFRQ
jgi:hypothetical protein